MRARSGSHAQAGLLVAAALAAGLAACDTPSSPADPLAPPAVVLFIGDGMGAGALEAARLAGAAPAIHGLPVRKTVLTLNAEGGITDSAAGATAYATGYSTYNRAIGVDADGVPRETVLEVARRAGRATGLVATSSVTHATPAAFGAHVGDRSLEHAIALQLSLSGVDVLLGGGLQYFDGDVRPDGLRLTEVFAERGCAVWLDPAALGDRDAPCALGLFAPGGLPPADERTVSLRAMTEAALAILSESENGFFLMVEGSQIDWAAHAHDGPRLVAEMADFDAAVAAAVQFLEGRENTTVVVTADHETGGLTPRLDADTLVFAWTTPDHTAVPVPLFGWGREVGLLEDTLANHDLGRFLLERVRP